MDVLYLDTCVLSSLAKEDANEEELDAMIWLLRKHKEGEVKLVTSPLTMNELEKIPIRHRRKHEAFYLLVEDVAVSRAGWLSGVIGGGVIPFPVEDPLLTKLKKILPNENDAHHAFHAIKSGCNYFVTLDERTILKHSKKLFLEFDEFKVMSPLNMVELLSVPV